MEIAVQRADIRMGDIQVGSETSHTRQSEV